jgi:hypothetical protein
MRTTFILLLCSFGCLGRSGEGAGAAGTRPEKPGAPPPLPDASPAGEDAGASDAEDTPVEDEAPATVVTVCATGGADHTTLQEAVDASPDGAVLEVCPGVYPERVAVAGRSLALVGTGGAGDTVVDALGEGVALSVTDGADLAVEGITFLSGSGEGIGGTVRCADASLTMTDSEIRGGFAPRGGGLGASRCVVSLTRLLVTQNTGEEMGGGLHFEESAGELADSEVRGNEGGNGGGVSVLGGAMQVRRNAVERNDAFVEGGGVWLSAPIVWLVENTVAENSAVWSGGGLYVYEGAGQVIGNHVVGNVSAEDGGGICTWTSAAHLADNVVEDNRAQDDAGGLRVFHGENTLIERNTFVGNACNGDGGGAKVSHQYNEIVDNRFEANTAGGSGGGLEIDDDTSHVVGGRFVGNVAGGSGGGLHSSSAWYDLVVEGARFEGNVASGCGGGAGVEDDDPWGVTFLGVTFVGNTAGTGGGLCVQGARVAVSNALFVDNVADTGAGIDVDGAFGTLAFATVWGNVGASAVELGSDVEVHDSIVGGTKGGAGVRGAAERWRYNDVWANEGGDYDEMGDPTGSDGNLAADPVFVAPADLDYHLAPESPCIDAGEPEHSDADGSRADIGAFGGTGGSW